MLHVLAGSSYASIAVDKRYQVFVSSTYDDLPEERAEVMQALLELNCMPAGMELFPAASDEQWTWIKRVVDESDYYIVIVGGRYGSIHEKTGISYTEMEYRYAVEIGKPTIAFLHEDPSKLEAWRCETSEEARDKLSDFTILLRKKLCKYWTNPHDLGAKVSRSLTQLMRHEPAVGWVRGNLISEDGVRENLRMRRRIEDLENQLADLSQRGPEGIEGLSQGSDAVSVGFTYETKKPKRNKAGIVYWVRGDEYEGEKLTSWDKLFSIVAPKILAPRDRKEAVGALNSFLWRQASLEVLARQSDEKVIQVRVRADALDTIRMQFRALGLLSVEYGEWERERWSLTPYGERHAAKLLAVHRPQRELFDQEACNRRPERT